MGKEYKEIDAPIQRWIERQHMFFVATAPLGRDGLVNCSPKGLDTLRVLGPHRIAYLDFGGSGIETVAHLNENQRITIMLCAFEGPPNIFRFYGKGRSVDASDSDFESLLREFPEQVSVRNIIVVDVDRIIDSCGYGVPEYEYRKQRESLANWANNQTEQELGDYRRKNNLQSLDGLPGLKLD